MSGVARTGKLNRRIWVVVLVSGLLASASQAALSPGLGIKVGNERISPFVELSLGYDSNARLSEGEVLPLQPDGSYQIQSDQEDDFFSQFTVGVGVSRVLASEWDLRMRSWYDTRLYINDSDYNYDSVTVEGSGRYWPVSDMYTVLFGGKYREAQDVERVPASANLTMPGDTALPYLEERTDRLKRKNLDGFGSVSMRPQERTSFTLGGNASTVNYDDDQLFDSWNWAMNGEAGYRYSEKTYVFSEVEYSQVDGDGLSSTVPVYAFRVGLKTRPREKVDYKVGVGVKTYEYWEDTEGLSEKRKWDPDFDAQLNWRYSEKLIIFGKAWTDVTTAIQPQATEDLRRTYAGQLGADYVFMSRMSAAGAISYRLDDYDYPVDYGNGQTQDKSELWQVMLRVMLAPRANAFWKVFAETSYEMGDNDLDNYDQWQILAGASLWY